MKRDLPKYPKYKPTGFEWLSQIPQGWELIRLARLNNKLTNGYVGPTRDILTNEGVRYLQSLHIQNNRIDFHKPYYVSEKWSESHLKSVLRLGDVLIVQTGADTGQVAAVTHEFVGCNCHALIIVSAKEQRLKGFFLAEVLNSTYGQRLLESIRTGALHPHLNCTLVREIFIPIPSLDEQQAILTFINREAAKIDRLIQVRRAQMERLQEQRTAVIHHAVTKGLDPNARMKPSGVEWLGKIPAHWVKMRLRFVCNIRGGFGFPDRLQGRCEGRYPFLKVSDINSGGRTSQGAENYVSDEDIEREGWAVIPKGALVLGKIGEALRKNHRMFIERECLIDNNLMALVPNRKRFIPDYFYYIFRLIDMDWFSNPGTVPSVSIRAFQNCWLPLPRSEEQETIVTHIECETKKIDTLTDKYRYEIELLEEYRAALISHAVTGKIDVRGVVATAEHCGGTSLPRSSA